MCIELFARPGGFADPPGLTFCFGKKGTVERSLIKNISQTTVRTHKDYTKYQPKTQSKGAH
jgi:hypothetical protein